MIGSVGDNLQIAIPIEAALYAIAKKDTKGFGRLAVALVVNQIVLETLKWAIVAQRPNGRFGSFPSGHTAAAFLGAAFIITRYGIGESKEVRAATITTVVLAVFVGFSRWYCQAHWIKDIVAGACLGCVLGAL